jgi:hypothetical protein
MALPDLNSGRRKALRNLATRVCEPCWRRHGRRIPIDLEQIAKDADLPVEFRYHKDRLGWIENRGGNLRIFIDPELPSVSLQLYRFTLAHELGHFFIPAHWKSLMAGQGIYYEVLPGNLPTLVPEQEANYFAAALLMPDPEFLPYLEGTCLTLDLLHGLKKRFVVSLESAAIRYVQAARGLSAVIVIPPEGQHWMEVSEGLKKLGVYRDSKLTRCRRSFESEATTLGNWFEVPLSKQALPFAQEIHRYQDGGTTVLLREGFF